MDDEEMDYEFIDVKQLKKIIRNIDVLTCIQLVKPKSIYELASVMQKDVGNLNRIISFLEGVGAIRVDEKVVKGRNVKTPIVEYQKIEFDLVA